MSQNRRSPTHYISKEVIANETTYKRSGRMDRRIPFRNTVHPYDRLSVVRGGGCVRLDRDINEWKHEGGNEMNVNIKRLSPDAQTPTYAHETDAGFDLVAAADVIIEPGQTVLVPTGLAFEIPEGYEMQIRPRSGITLKTKLRVQLGTVDAGYRGEVGVIVDNIAQKEHFIEDGVNDYGESHVIKRYAHDRILHTVSGKEEIHADTAYLRHSYIIRKGDRIAQAVIKSVEHAVFTEVEALDDSDRGAGGFGSSGVVAESYEKANERNGGALERLAKEDE